jgi:hypothetical protein
VSEELVELLVVPDSELEVTRDDTRLLVVPRCVASQLENLSREVWEEEERKGSAQAQDGCAQRRSLAHTRERRQDRRGHRHPHAGHSSVLISGIRMGRRRKSDKEQEEKESVRSTHAALELEGTEHIISR